MQKAVKRTSGKKKQIYFRMPKKYDIPIHLCTILLVFYGIAMIGSASMGQSVNTPSYVYTTMIKQAGFALIGYVLMTTAANRFHLKLLDKPSLSIVFLVMIGVLAITRAFPSVKGAHAWIRLGAGGMEITIQPSEFAKILTYLCIAYYLGDRKTVKRTGWDLLKAPVLIIFLYCVIVLVLEEDLGSAVVIFFIAFACVNIPSNPALAKWQKTLRIAMTVLLFIAVYLVSPLGVSAIESLPLKTYQKNRFLSAIDPFQDLYGAGYQLVNGLVAFASGGLFGRGFGQSIRKYTRFPAANTDFILSILVEELGFAGFAVLMILYGVIIFRLLGYANRIRNEKAKIILTGTAVYFLIHIIFNIGGVTGLIPLTGVPLLMMSYGGSSLLSILISIGLSQAVISAYHKGEIA